LLRFLELGADAATQKPDLRLKVDPVSTAHAQSFRSGSKPPPCSVTNECADPHHSRERVVPPDPNPARSTLRHPPDAAGIPQVRSACPAMTSPRAGLEQANRNGLLPLWIGAKVGNSLGFEPLSIAKKLGVCPCPNKVDPVGLHL